VSSPGGCWIVLARVAVVRTLAGMTPVALVLSSRSDLVEEVRAAGAAAGVRVVVVDPQEPSATAPASWSDAGTVVVGSDALAGGVGSLRARGSTQGVVVAVVGELALEDWPRVLDLGAEAVLELPRDRGELVARLGRPPVGSDALVLGVLGGRGGAGASVLSARLASAFADAGELVLALDADPDGPGLDVVLAMEQVPGARWSQLGSLGEALPPAALREALPTAASLAVLAHDASAESPGTPPSAGEMLRVLDSARSAYDVVVVDLPRAREDVLAAIVPRCAELLVAVTSDVCGAAAAARILRRLPPGSSPRLVVREVPGSDLEPDELVAWLGAPIAAQLPHDPRLVLAIDQGRAPSPRSRWSRTVRDLARGVEGTRRTAA
jgi:secretion/DNA translocation related CpaE-like protein